MKPLATTRQMFTWLCICPIENLSLKKQFCCICFTLMIISALCSLMIASVAYAIKFISIDIENALYTVGQIFCWFPVLYSFITALTKRLDINMLYTKLDEIYAARKYYFRNILTIFYKFEINKL